MMLLVLFSAASFSFTVTHSLSDLSMSENNYGLNGKSNEYCLAAEAFSPKCLKNEIILMNTAMYGRMTTGRCLQKESLQLHNIHGKDPLFLGCSVDVLDILDKKCSGRNQCDIPGTDSDLQKKHPCHHGLTLYLEAHYECLTVIEDDRSCHVTVSFNPMHMTRISTSKQHCGTKIQPWILKALVGQQISINLVDFGSKSRTEQDLYYTSNCHQYGYVIDNALKKNVSICRTVDQRNTLVYKSFSNIIEIVLNQAGQVDNEAEYNMFLLRFTAVGCSNLIPPEDAWLKRDENEAVVGCYVSRQTWTLHCADSLWVGVIGNCTRGTDAVYEDVFLPKTSVKTNYQVLVIMAIVFIGGAVCLLVICCGAVLYKRYTSKINKYRRSFGETENGKYIQAVVEPKRENIQCTLMPST